MPKPIRRPAARTLALGLLCGLCFAVGLHLGGQAHPQEGTVSRLRDWVTSLPLTQSAEAAPASDLRSVETLWEVLDNLKKHYVEEKVDQTELTDGAIRGMLSQLGDRHTRYMSAKEYREFQLQNAGEFDGIGAALREVPQEKTGETWLIIDRLIGESPAKKAGVREGDRIMKIDGKSALGLSVDEAATLIRGPRGTEVVLTLSRKGKAKPFDLKITRQLIEMPSVRAEMVEPGIGHLIIIQFNSKTEELVDAGLADLKKQGLKALILDVRGDPGGLLDAAVGVASRFLRKGTVVTTRGRDGEETLTADPAKYAKLNVPLCILVDGGSASASEILAGALQDHGLAKVIGTKTYGKASVQVVIGLQNEGALALTTAKYLTPKGRDLNQHGLTPDVEVEVTEADVQNKKDPQLARAVEVMKAQLAAGETLATRRSGT